MRSAGLALWALVAIAPSAALADTVGIVPTMLFAKFRLTDTLPKARFVFFARDPAVHKGTATDAAAVSAELALGYNTAEPTYGIPPGAFDGTRGWIVNSEHVAKYVNKAAEFLDPVRVTIVKPGRTIKLQARNSGLGILNPPANTDVVVCYTITNGAEEHRFGGRWPSGTCTHYVYGTSVTGQVSVLQCKGGGIADASACPAP
jgi:hypothetical protein